LLLSPPGEIHEKVVISLLTVLRMGSKPSSFEGVDHA
jgi:hypothetical protein